MFLPDLDHAERIPLGVRILTGALTFALILLLILCVPPDGDE